MDMKKLYETIDFEFDHTLSSSLVLVIGDLPQFENNKFLKKYYGISYNNDEGETQSIYYLESLINIKVDDSIDSGFGFDFVTIKTDNIEDLCKELIEKNFSEIWVFNGKKFECISIQSENEITPSTLLKVFESGIPPKGVVFEVVQF